MEDLKEYTEGPLKLLTESLINYNMILIDIEDNRRIIANIIGFDSHFYMVLTNVKKEWSVKYGRRGILVNKERYLAKMFLPGHNVKIIVKLAY